MEIFVNYGQLNLLLSDLERYAAIVESLSEQIAPQPRSSSLHRTAYENMQSSCTGLQKLKTVLGSAILEYTATEDHLCASFPSSHMQMSFVSYVKENGVDQVFSSFNFATHYVDDIGFFTGFGYFFSHFNDNIKALINSCGSLEEFWNRLMDGSLSAQIADEFMNDKESVKGILSGVIESMLDNKVESMYKGTEIKTIKALDQLTDVSVSKELRQILDTSYSTNKGLSEISKAAEKVGYLLTDYSDNIELLNSLRNIAPDNKALNEVLDDILFDYQHKFTALVRDEIVDKVEEFSGKTLDSILGTNFGLVNKAIAGTIGQMPSIDALDTVIHVENVRSAAIRTYKTAVDTIKTGTYTETDFKAYVNSFNLCKELTLKEYRAMLKHYDNPFSKEHLYLDNQIKELENMTYDKVSSATAFNQFNAASDGSGYGGMSSSGGGFGGGGGGGGFGF